jgi:hypothetical protein
MLTIESIAVMMVVMRTWNDVDRCDVVDCVVGLLVKQRHQFAMLIKECIASVQQNTIDQQ